MSDILENYHKVRQRTLNICKPLKTEDYVVQPVVDVSPPKWHLGHTSWFFEAFILKPHAAQYKEFNPDYNYLFNSYYESVGTRVIRTNRGNLSRPAVEEIISYRKHVDKAMEAFLADGVSEEMKSLVTLGLNHEEQHEELLYTDIKYILGHNPLFPAYAENEFNATNHLNVDRGFVNRKEGIYEIGFEGNGFCFDNELCRHKVYLQNYEISKVLVTNGEYLEFINSGGYHDFHYWHSDGWSWVTTNGIESPMYWHKIDGQWQYYTWQGIRPLDLDIPVCHVSFYEAAAYAAWKKMRLPTEAEWECAAHDIKWGQRWEWTESAYLPYPGFTKAPGAIGEYNGKFMVNQMVLRGASEVTPPGHSRITYRNFFQPELRWQFTGIRLVK